MGNVSDYQLDLLRQLEKYKVETIIASIVQPDEPWCDLKAQARDTIRYFICYEWVTPKTNKLTKKGREVLQSGWRGF